MAYIYVVDKIKLSNKGVIAKDESGKWVGLHKRQGNLDGACAVYSLVMGLICIGAITGEDTQIYNSFDMRTLKGRFLSHFLEKQGLVRDGYYFKTLAKEINEQGLNIVAYRKCPNDNNKRAKTIAEYIKHNIPVIISTEFTDGAHALLAIGIEYSTNDDIKKIFCLDTEESSPKYAAWNCIIDVSSNRDVDYPYDYITNSQACKVSLADLLIIEKI